RRVLRKGSVTRPRTAPLWTTSYAGRRALLDRTGDQHHDRRPRRGRAPPARAGRARRRRAARRPVVGDRGTGGAAPPVAGGAADGVGQVGGLLRRHLAAALGWRRPDRDRLA